MTVKRGRGPKKGEGGRPPIEIDWAAVDDMAFIQCTQKEICSVLKISQTALLDNCKRIHGMTSQEYIQEKGEGGKESLRRCQYKTALKGNVTMLIWLGKQWLGQKDKQEISSGDNNISADELSTSALEKIVKQSKSKK